MKTNHLMMLILTTGFLLAVARLLSSLTAAGTAPDLPFASLISLLLGAVPWVAGFAIVLSVLVMVLREAPFARYEPLADGQSGAMGVGTLRSVLRRVREWLARQQLPAVTGPLTESIGSFCCEIEQQLAGREPAELAVLVSSLRKLLGIELPTLVLSYQRVPLAKRLLPLLSTPADEMLLAGLRAVDDQLRTIHEELTRSDIHDLAVQSRYLELKSADKCGSAVVHGLIFGPTRSGKTSLMRSEPEPQRFPPRPWPVRTGCSNSERRSEAVDSGSTLPLIALGAAAAAVVALEESREDSESERDCGGMRGALGGGGTVGDRSPDLDTSSESDTGREDEGFAGNDGALGGGGTVGDRSPDLDTSSESDTGRDERYAGNGGAFGGAGASGDWASASAGESGSAVDCEESEVSSADECDSSDASL